MMGGTFVAKFVGFFYKMVIVNKIGMEGFSYYSTAYSVYYVLYSLSVAGLPLALAKIVTENAHRGLDGVVEQAFRVAKKLFTCVGFVLMLVMLLFSDYLAVCGGKPEAKLVIVALAPVALFTCISSAYKGYYEGLLNMYPTTWSEIIEAGTKLVFSSVFATVGMKVGAAQFSQTGAIFGMVVATKHTAEIICGAAGAILGISISCVIGSCFLAARRKFDGAVRVSGEERPTKEMISTILSLAIPFCLSAVVARISGFIDSNTIQNGLKQAVAAEPLFFNKMVSAVKTYSDIPALLWGGYSTLLSIYNFIPAMLFSFGVSLLPNLAAAWSSNNTHNIKKYMESGLRITNILAISAGLTVTVSAKSILMLLFLKRPTEVPLCVPSLRILGICIIFSAVTTTLNIILQSIGRVKLPVIMMTIGVIIKYIVNKTLITIPEVNIKSGAWGTLACYLFIAVFGFCAVRKFTHVRTNIKSVFAKPILVGICTMITGLLTEWASNRLPGGQTFWLKNLFAVGMPIFACGIFTLVFRAIEEEDILMLPRGEKLATFLKKHKLISVSTT
ncbi:polysaccharide biosynthesis protein [Clostridia bacterium]|nr:polysaccharide biosynthesis protein [Clostridia bacterium]